jgi:hypothetical protein
MTAKNRFIKEEPNQDAIRDFNNSYLFEGNENNKMRYDPFDPGNWIMFSKLLLKIMPIREAVVLSFLYNVKRISGTSVQIKRNGWFHCSTKLLEQDSTLSTDQQRRAIKTLIKMGVVDAKMGGNPPKRFVRIDYQKLDELLAAKLEE